MVFSLTYMWIWVVLWVIILGGVNCQDSPYWIYGIFSIRSCQSRFDFNCMNAFKNQQIMEQTISSNNKILNTNMDFCAQDIGDSQASLINSLLSGLLKGEFNISGKCMDKSMQGIHKTEALFVYTHVTFELTQLVSAILMPFDIPLIAITFQNMYPAQYVSNPLYVYSYEASFGKEIHKTGINNFRKELNITIAAILNLIDYENKDSSSRFNQFKDCRGEDQGAFCTYIGLEVNTCMKERYLDVNDDTDLNKTLSVILRTPRLSFVLVQGASNLLATFQGKILALRKKDTRLKRLFFLNFELETEKSPLNPTLLTTHSYGDKDLVDDIIYDLPGSMGLNTLFHYVHHLADHFLTNDFVERITKFYSLDEIKRHLIESNPTRFSLLNRTNISLALWKTLPDSYKKNIFQELRFTRELISAYLKFWKDLFYLDLLKVEKVFLLGVLNPTVALEAKPFCHLTIPQCDPGTQLLHTYYTEPEWNRSYGYHCKKCPSGFYKKTKGNRKCIACPDYQRSTRDRKSCYDPYKSIYLKFNDSVAMLTYIIVSIFHGIFMIFTLFIFYRQQHTPLVRASNRNVSFVQIATHIILTFTPLLIFSGVPTVAQCTARPITIGLLFSVTIAVNFGKTQKVLHVFGTLTRMSRKQVLLTKATEIFVILFIVLVDTCVLIVTLIVSDETSVSITYYKMMRGQALVKEYQCSNNDSVLVQYGFVFVVILTNAVQGIRARNLPSHYRETMYVIYASFTSSIILIASAAIYLSQSSVHARTVVLFFTSLALNISHFLLIYVYKVMVLLCYANLNRSSVFRRRRQQKIASALLERSIFTAS